MTEYTLYVWEYLRFPAFGNHRFPNSLSNKLFKWLPFVTP